MARKPGLEDGADIVPEWRADDLSADRTDILAGDAAPSPSEEHEAGSGLSENRPLTIHDKPDNATPPSSDIEPDRADGLGLGDAPKSVILDDAVVPAAGPDTADPWRLRSTSETVADDPSRVEKASAVPPLAVQSSFIGNDGHRGSDSAAPPAFVAPPQRRGGFGALLLGGMIAAALGAGTAWFAQDRWGLLPLRLSPETEARLAALEARPLPDESALQDLPSRLDQIEAQIAASEEIPAVATDLDSLRAELAEAAQAAETRASVLEQRIAALETAPTPPTGTEAPLGSLAVPGPDLLPTTAASPDAATLRDEVLAALEPRLTGTETALTELRTGLADLGVRVNDVESSSTAAVEQASAATAAAAEVEARAAAAEREARAGSALSTAQAALDAGEPLTAALAELEAAGVAVPEALSARADEGVATLAALREAFPDAARAALTVARNQGLVQDGAGVMGFLREQLSVRSVTPREGQDPDAVLSRAEAQLSQGNLSAALAEVEALPEPVRATMTDWITQAQARAEATAALAALRDARPDAEPPTLAD